MMLTDVLLRHVAQTTSVVVPPVLFVTWLVLGPDVAVGTAFGALVSIGDASAMIFLVGRLMEPATPRSKKMLFAAVLIGKLVVVGAVLWLGLTRSGISDLGAVIGIGVGVLVTVVGASRGSTSEAGQTAIRDAEKNIRDSEEESR